MTISGVVVPAQAGNNAQISTVTDTMTSQSQALELVWPVRQGRPTIVGAPEDNQLAR